MKVKIAYTKDEEKRANRLATLFLEELQRQSSVTFTRSDRHKPFFHIYIADKLRKKALDNSKKK